MKKSFHYAIFDLDGTIIDSMPYWDHLGRDYLLSRGIEPEPDLEKILLTMSMKESCHYFIERYGLQEDEEIIRIQLDELMKENYIHRIPAKPGVSSYIDRLHQEGISMAICSSSSLEMIRQALSRLELLRYFPVVVSCDEVGVGKESSAAYERTLSRMNAQAEDCAIFEDSIFAIKTAKQLGCHVVGVYDASCPEPPDVVRSCCDEYIEDFLDLL